MDHTFTEEIIARYAEKIYGFAYSKTRNSYDAEDLSQEILLELCDKDFTKIENMDAYIWRISMYTWSNYVRKNKNEWRALDNTSALDFLASDENVEEDCIRSELFERLRREIMYLGELRRSITVMYYYDNLKGDEIAAKLGIPSSTVRWHIRKIKDTLKERMVMTRQSEIYEPVRLQVGHSGWCPDFDMHGLGSDLIMQNICWACRNKAMTVEEIGHEIGVAAAYLEDRLTPLCELDYVRRIGANKYITNFLIKDAEYIIEESRWQYGFTYHAAKMAYDMMKENLGKIRETMKIDGEFSDEFLLSSLLVPELNRISAVIGYMICRRKNLEFHYVTPKRSDGSEHWVQACMVLDGDMDEYRRQDSGYVDFLSNTQFSSKTREACGIQSMQFDMNIFGGWRLFDGNELVQLRRMHDLNEAGLLPDERDMDAVANLSAKGYIRVEDGKPVILVPYIGKTGAKLDAEDIIGKYEKLLAGKLDIDAMADACLKTVGKVKKLIPVHLDENIRNFHLGSCVSLSPGAMMYSLYENGDLSMPGEDEKKRLLTLVWEIG